MPPRTIFKPVTEPWYGNYKIQDDKRFEDVLLVTVRLVGLNDGKFRVCVWGNDDLGMEKDFEDDLQATQVFSAIVLEESLTRKTLEDKYNFVYC